MVLEDDLADDRDSIFGLSCGFLTYDERIGELELDSECDQEMLQEDLDDFRGNTADFKLDTDCNDGNFESSMTQVLRDLVVRKLRL